METEFKLEFEWAYFRFLPKKWPSVLVANFVEHSIDWLGFRLSWYDLGIDRSNVENIR